MQREQAEFRCFCNIQMTKYLSQHSLTTFPSQAEADRFFDFIFRYWCRLFLQGIPPCQGWEEEMLYFYHYDIPFHLLDAPDPMAAPHD